MAWLILVGSGVLEAVWATALSRSDGFTRLIPSVIFGVALVFSMVGLAIAMRSLPPGTSYAVWVGIGAALTILYAMLTGQETAPPIKVVLMTGIVGCVIGLKVISWRDVARAARPRAAPAPTPLSTAPSRAARRRRSPAASAD
jgi:quaternary ammonium compound-resistance protein SugE